MPMVRCASRYTVLVESARPPQGGRTASRHLSGLRLCFPPREGTGPFAWRQLRYNRQYGAEREFFEINFWFQGSRVLLALNAGAETVCVPFETVVESQVKLYGGDEVR